MSWFFPKSPSPEYLDSCQDALDEYPEVMRFVLKKIIDEYKGDIERFKEDNGLKLLGPEQFKALLTGKLPAIITEFDPDSLPSNRWNPEIEAMRELVGEKLREILSSYLNVREALVLAAHAGYNCSPMTFKEISMYLNISHGRVCQIAKNTIDKLKTRCGYEIRALYQLLERLKQQG